MSQVEMFDKPPETITIDDMKAQVALIDKLRREEDEVRKIHKNATSKTEEAEARMLAMLEASNLKNFRSDDGLVSVGYRTSVRTPKTPEDRKALFDYLQKIGVYDQMITVNSQTLNSFYKEELEKAKEAGADDFEIPGLNEVTIAPILSFRRSK